MKALLPIFCRPMGYVILIICLFLPFLFVMWGIINDNNLLFYKECIKLLMMIGALMILLALTKDETFETEKIRIKAMRNAVFVTFIFIFFNMLIKVATRDAELISSASFLTFLIINVICLEFGLKKDLVDKIFKR
ncbi:hypothetical protein D0T50_12065 [Bacteroides sp. 214]|uniref:hypothetical protein n=1 Tax=Bacteroides sp. 214 TaxID=2302935 RepID=UPI0013D72292|nr:hypothetical protein [Bacteroides sp. 214]NDW13620.1 hypothetical protein [Bacteroides sp. 214]